MNSTQVAVGIALAVGVAFLARRARALAPSGAWAAVLVGSITFGFGGLLPALLLMTFFISSSLLSRAGAARKVAVAAAFDKGGERDAGQVLANGGVAAAASLAYGLTRDPRWLAAIAGALAAVNADTWATELGVLARGWPRRLTDGRLVEPGTSGAASVEGLLAAIGGAALIGLPAGLAAPYAALQGPSAGTALGVAATLGGFFGSLADSLLGATVQAIYWCPACGKETERHPTHICGTATRRLRGWPWLRNDGVNLAASIVGAAIALFLTM
ncbi:MAG TPA: DUF92 domain-containing protein [Anaerolineales bacterium]|nr:DUF92 domain-containing protein [Anaerolineales bacterium]